VRIIAVANQKGGCGKTTTSINFAACLAYLGKKVLMIDMDPQGHAGCGLGIPEEEGRKSAFDLLRGEEFQIAASPELIRSVNSHLDVIPAYENLSGLEEAFAGRPDRKKRLKTALHHFRRRGMLWDFVVLDCPPNLGILTDNALEAADEIIIPVEPSFFSLHGLAKISETLRRVHSARECPLLVHALLTIFNSENSFYREIYEEVRKYFRDQLFKTVIHESVLLKEASGAGQSIVDYNRYSQPFRDYLSLATEYLERNWDRILPREELGWDHVLSSRFGPRLVSGGVLFQLLSKTARCVEVAGDFNGWIPEALIYRHESGLWQKVVGVNRGAFRYKYIVDGEWQVDPCQPAQLSNAFGGYDSYVEIA
jgi:chromosome partitioning protein